MLMKDENEKCVSCIKSGHKFCLYGDGLSKCCDINDFSAHCQSTCSNQIDYNSLYSQYRVCPQREAACGGNRFVNATFEDQFLTSTSGYFHVNITCVYHIENPLPDHPLYFTIYRKTNDSELGLYFIEEHADGLREYSTIVYDIPKKQNLFSGVEVDNLEKGEPYHNSSDINRRYVFNKIRRLHVVALGKSENSQFDFSVSISVLSASTWDTLVLSGQIIIGSILGLTFLYVVAKELILALKKRSHSQLQEEIEEDQAAQMDQQNQKQQRDEIREQINEDELQNQ